ncbi:hypothetical protein Tco_1339371, partial [Tanacetum coccineum]
MASSCCSIKKRLSLSNLLFRHIHRRHKHHFQNTSSDHNRYISTTTSYYYFFNNKHLLASNTHSFLKPYASCYRSFTTDDDSGQVAAETKGFFDYNDNYTTASVDEVVGSVGEVVAMDQAIVPGL